MVFHLGVNVLLPQGPTQKVRPANKTISENKKCFVFNQFSGKNNYYLMMSYREAVRKVI